MVIIAQAGAIAGLAYASYKDIKGREIPDTPWVAMGVTGVILRVVDHQWKMMAISVGAAVLLGVVLAASNLFGGADIKAFLALSLLIPTYPGVVLPIFIVSAFNNLVVLRVTELIAVLFYNMVNGNTYHELSLGKKILLLMTGFPKKTKELDYRFLPLQDTKGDLHLLPDIDVDIEEFKKECGLEEIWVTYGSPLIVYLLIGCLIAFAKGDIILYLLMYFV